jgi:hypothetical protein
MDDLGEGKFGKGTTAARLTRGQRAEYVRNRMSLPTSMQQQTLELFNADSTVTALWVFTI